MISQDELLQSRWLMNVGTTVIIIDQDLRYSKYVVAYGKRVIMQTELKPKQFMLVDHGYYTRRSKHLAEANSLRECYSNSDLQMTLDFYKGVN